MWFELVSGCVYASHVVVNHTVYLAVAGCNRHVPADPLLCMHGWQTAAIVLGCCVGIISLGCFVATTPKQNVFRGGGPS